ncbi:MAG: hypothetical protein H6741_31550 [Alphaproteobacteria bacterium]|nr:hypothetical protein [Alphaproteobacteria bacterium]
MSALLLLLIGCEAEPEAVDSADACAQAGALGWESFAAGFFATYCSACHSSTSPDRRGAPEGIDFDDEAMVRAQTALIRSAVLERGSMPLGGGVYPDDLEKLALYLDCPPVALPGVQDPVEDVTLQPRWSAAELSAALSEAVAGGFPYPEPLLDDYLALMALGDAECPGDATQITDIHLYGCTAESGAYYSGITEYREEDAVYEGVDIHGRALVGDAMLLSPEGLPMDLGGHGAIFDAVSGDQGDWDMRGTLRWAGAEQAWLREGISAWFVASWRQLERGRATQLNGALSFSGVSLDFAEFRLDPDSCGWSASGTLLVRDPDGGWFSGDFEPCDPCAPLAFEGKPTGEDFCPDLALLGAALATPGVAP